MSLSWNCDRLTNTLNLSVSKYNNYYFRYTVNHTIMPATSKELTKGMINMLTYSNNALYAKESGLITCNSLFRLVKKYAKQHNVALEINNKDKFIVLWDILFCGYCDSHNLNKVVTWDTYKGYLTFPYYRQQESHHYGIQCKEHSKIAKNNPSKIWIGNFARYQGYAKQGITRVVCPKFYDNLGIMFNKKTCRKILADKKNLLELKRYL